MLDRVAERRRAAQLARHYRDQEGLSIAEIARRLGRAEATIKTYLYDPTGEKARAVKARYRGVCGGCGADTPAARRQGRRLRVLQTLPSRRDRAAMDPGTGSRSNASMASALRRCAVVVRLVAHPRTPARRRCAERYRPENGQRRPPSSICTGPGRRPAPTSSAAPERLGLDAVDTRTLACAWSSLMGGGEDRRNATAIRLFSRSNAAVGAG